MFQLSDHPIRKTGLHIRPETQADVEARQQTRQFMSLLEDYMIEKYGDQVAVIKAQMLFDACGPRRDFDPASLFEVDSEGDAWAEATANLSF